MLKTLSITLFISRVMKPNGQLLLIKEMGRYTSGLLSLMKVLDPMRRRFPFLSLIEEKLLVF